MKFSLWRQLGFAVSMGPGYLRYRLKALAAVPRLRMCKHLDRFKGVGLEIGGPSAVFRSNGLIPIYEMAERIDNIQFSERTRWEGVISCGQTFNFSSDKPPGTQYILEGAALSDLPNARYDFIASSHMLEHSANPIGALRRWKELLKDSSTLLLVLPHRDGTFDHRRPVTTMRHLLEDDARGTAEDDDTHLSEILRLHDLNRDPEQRSRADFERWILGNAVNRGAHHHVFDTRTAAEMVQAAGLVIADVEPSMPFHIVLLATNVVRSEAGESEPCLDGTSTLYRRSPFASDRKPSG